VSAIFGQRIRAGTGSGGNVALVEEEEKANDKPNGGDFFRRIVSLSAFQ
jgi:hypothetical protein